MTAIEICCNSGIFYPRDSVVKLVSSYHWEYKVITNTDQPLLAMMSNLVCYYNLIFTPVEQLLYRIKYQFGMFCVGIPIRLVPQQLEDEINMMLVAIAASLKL